MVGQEEVKEEVEVMEEEEDWVEVTEEREAGLEVREVDSELEAESEVTAEGKVVGKVREGMEVQAEGLGDLGVAEVLEAD